MECPQMVVDLAKMLGFLAMHPSSATFLLFIFYMRQ